MSTDGEKVIQNSVSSTSNAGAQNCTAIAPKKQRTGLLKWPLATVAAIIAIIVIVAGISAYIIHTFFTDEYSGEPPTSTLTMTPLNYGWNFTFGPVTRDTHWNEVELVLNDSASIVSITMRTDDLDNGFRSRVLFADIAFGPAMVFCNVTDLQGNGWVDNGDYFAFTTGTVTHFDPNTLNTVKVLHDPSQTTMCNSSFQGYKILPAVTMDVSSLLFGYYYFVTFIDSRVDWGDLTIELKPIGTIWQDVTIWPKWSPATSDLSGGEPRYKNFSEQLVGNTTFSCNITDHAGNGYLDQGDNIYLSARGYTFPGRSCHLAISYEPSSYYLWNSSFRGFYSGVTANLLKTTVPFGFSFAIEGLSSSIIWDALEIHLMDNTDVDAWSPVEGEFTGGTPCVWRFAGVPLGILTIFCNVTDVHGSSTVVANGDFFALTTGSDHQFDPSGYYMATINNPQTGEIIASLFFQG